MKSKSKQPEDQPKTSEQSERPETPKAPTKSASWPLPKGCKVMDGKPESHIFVGGVRPPNKQK